MMSKAPGYRRLTKCGTSKAKQGNIGVNGEDRKQILNGRYARGQKKKKKGEGGQSERKKASYLPLRVCMIDLRPPNSFPEEFG